MLKCYMNISPSLHTYYCEALHESKVPTRTSLRTNTFIQQTLPDDSVASQRLNIHAIAITNTRQIQSLNLNKQDGLAYEGFSKMLKLPPAHFAPKRNSSLEQSQPHPHANRLLQ